MAEKKLYGASFGPYLYSDDAVINDPDGDFANFVEHASISDGGHLCAFVELLDTNQSHGLKIYWNENDTGHRALALLLGGGDRSLTLNESFTIGDGYSGTLTFSGDSKTLEVEDDSNINQDVTTDGTPTFGEVRLTPKASSDGPEGTIFYDSDDNHVYVGTE